MESIYENMSGTVTISNSIEIKALIESEVSAGMIIPRIHYKSIKVEFNKPLLFELKHPDRFYEAENKNLNIICYNETLDGLHSDIEEELFVLWTEFVSCEDSTLDPSGIELKEKLLSFTQ